MAAFVSATWTGLRRSAGGSVRGGALAQCAARRRPRARMTAAATPTAVVAQEGHATPAVEVADGEGEWSQVTVRCRSVPGLLKAVVAAVVGELGLEMESFVLRVGEDGVVDFQLLVRRDGIKLGPDDVQKVSTALTATIQEPGTPVEADAVTERRFRSREVADLELLEEEDYADYETGAFVVVDNGALMGSSSVTVFSKDSPSLVQDILEILTQYPIDISFASSAVNDLAGRYRTTIFHFTTQVGQKIDEVTEHELNVSLFGLAQAASK